MKQDGSGTPVGSGRLKEMACLRGRPGDGLWWASPKWAIILAMTAAFSMMAMSVTGPPQQIQNYQAPF